jgi:hypothetical protein
MSELKKLRKYKQSWLFVRLLDNFRFSFYCLIPIFFMQTTYLWVYVTHGPVSVNFIRTSKIKLILLSYTYFNIRVYLWSICCPEHFCSIIILRCQRADWSPFRLHYELYKKQSHVGKLG